MIFLSDENLTWSEQEEKIKNDNSQEIFDWRPKNYTPNLSVDDWIELLNDKNIFQTSFLEVVKRFQDIGGEASCKELSKKYGETWQFYSNATSNIGIRISKKN